jgi:hypothetical protein
MSYLIRLREYSSPPICAIGRFYGYYVLDFMLWSCDWVVQP